MLRDGWVYGLVDPRTRKLRYVGVTKRHPNWRLRKHLQSGRAAQRGDPRMSRSPVALWMAKLQGLGLVPSVVVLDRWQPWERDPYEVEVEVIARLRPTTDLLNVTPGGRGGGTGPKSEAHRAAMSRAGKGRLLPPRTEEWRAAHSAKMTGRQHAPGTRAKMSETQQRRSEAIKVEVVCGACSSVVRVIPSRARRAEIRCEGCRAK